MRRKIGIALALLGAWLLLDTTFSWLATRDPGYNPEPYDNSYNEECSALRGPLVLGLVGLKHWIGTYFHKSEDVIAFFTVVLAASTIGLWWSTRNLWIAGEAQREHAEGVAKRQSREMRDSIAQARRAADTAERALVATQRPWVKIATVHMAEALSYDVNGLRLSFTFHLENVGNTPAIAVFPHPHVYFPNFSGEGPASNVLAQQQLIIEGGRTRPPNTQIGNMLFPKEPRAQTITTNVARADLDASRRIAGLEESMEHLHLSLVAVVPYRSTLSEAWHHTSLIVDIYRSSAEFPGGFMPIKATDDIVPNCEIVQVRQIMGDYAD